MQVLVVVDMQNDFISGSLGTDEAKGIVSNVVEKVRSSVQRGGLVIFTQDTHGDDYLQTREGQNLPVVHCVKNTHGWAICDALAGYAADAMVFTKPTFGSVSLGEYLLELDSKEKIDEIHLCGLCTDICVISNALLIKAFLPETPVTVDAACCAGVTPKSHEDALAAMKMCQIQVSRGA